MLRYLAGVASCFLLMTGAFLLWQLHAAHVSAPNAQSGSPSVAASLFGGGAPLEAPEASEKTREEKRFSRYDKNKDGKVEADEYLAARRRNFDKLDADHSGTLSFPEYAAKGIEKFNTAGGRKGWLTAAEFVATAPPKAKHKAACGCRVRAPEVVQADDNNEGN